MDFQTFLLLCRFDPGRHVSCGESIHHCNPATQAPPCAKKYEGVIQKLYEYLNFGKVGAFKPCAKTVRILKAKLFKEMKHKAWRFETEFNRGLRRVNTVVLPLSDYQLLYIIYNTYIFRGWIRC